MYVAIVLIRRATTSLQELYTHKPGDMVAKCRHEYQNSNNCGCARADSRYQEDRDTNGKKRRRRCRHVDRSIRFFRCHFNIRVHPVGFVRLDNKAKEVVLDDYKESFPLIPPPAIPLLSLADLARCEIGLTNLLSSLQQSSSPEETQLLQYAEYELKLVRNQCQQLRAQERVDKLLRGELPMPSNPDSQPVKKSMSSRPLNRASSANVTTSMESLSRESKQNVHTASTKSSAKPPAGKVRHARWKKDIKSIVSSNANVKRTLKPVSSFVVSSGGSSLKQRFRERLQRQKQNDAAREGSREEYIAKEKERRKQAALIRLEKRRKLQEEKKRKRHEAVLAYITETNDVKPKSSEQQKPSECYDDISETVSDVSNCSSGDEMDEKNVMESSFSEVEHTDVDEDSGAIEEAPAIVDSGNTVEKLNETADEERVDAPSLSGLEDAEYERKGGKNSEKESSISNLADSKSLESKNDESTSKKDMLESNARVEETNSVYKDDVVRGEIEKQLLLLIEDRKQETLARLYREKEMSQNTVSFDAEIALHNGVAASNSVGISQSASTPLLPITSMDNTSSKDVEAGPEKIKQQERAMLTPKHLPEESQQLQNKTNSKITYLKPKVRPRTALPKNQKCSAREVTLFHPPSRRCVDYRPYFESFDCILTSVYERAASMRTKQPESCRGLRTGNVSSTNALRSQNGLNQQLKLYQTWSSIMNDYATVFGGYSTSSIAESCDSNGLHYRVNSSTRKEVVEILKDALRQTNVAWEEHPPGLGLKTTWNLLWTWSKPNVDRQTLLVWQRVNHFYQAKALTRKDCLKKHLGKYSIQGGKMRPEFEIMPQTFLLPNEYVAFVKAFQDHSRNENTNNLWIMKPVALSRGRGISLVSDLGDVVYSEPMIIQKYISNPLLLDDRKFDLRLYVLVTSFNPLEAFLYEEGFVRLCSQLYSNSSDQLDNLFVHLTNSSIQKVTVEDGPSEANRTNQHAQDVETGGTKTSLAYFWKRLEAMGANVKQVRADINSVIIKSLLCGEEHISYQVNSFDLFGYDILLDDQLRPWLLEINSSPSMARDHALDYQIKDAVMKDALGIVDPLAFDRHVLVEVLQRRTHKAEENAKRPHANLQSIKNDEESKTREMNLDLTAILNGRVPRSYGELPENMGNFIRLAPYTPTYNQLQKMMKGSSRTTR